MERVPENLDKGAKFTAADFLKAGRERLCLSLVSGSPAALARTIEEPMVNRPGLALTGFFKNFARKRVQTIGNAECAYLDSLGTETRAARMESLVKKHKAWLFVYTSGHHATARDLQTAAEAGAVVMETPLPTSMFSRLATFLLEQLAAPRTAFYGTMIEVCGIGVLLEGDPGVGKSETALGLIKRGAALVADDLTCLRKDVGSNLLFGSASDSTAGFMEIRGIGLVNLQKMFGVDSVRGEKRVQLVISLRRLEDVKDSVERTGLRRLKRTILGVEVPNAIVPVSEGRDLVNLVETAAQQQKLLASGYDPALDLSGRLKSRADEFEKVKTEGTGKWQARQQKS